ncbi:MAG: glycoside hydrolase family 3 C-terminal domain-containing protein [Bacteroidales bacterium]
MTGGSPITMPEVEELADAILWVWYPGQEGGNAVAEVLFGDTSPSGKLPLTFPVSADQLPPFEDYAMQGRTYRYMAQKPLYPFGYGLSYSRFELGEPVLAKDRIKAGETVQVSVEVTNTGSYDAGEVVQVYVSVPDPDGIQPRWSLKEFRRIDLKQGKAGPWTLNLDPGPWNNSMPRVCRRWCRANTSSGSGTGPRASAARSWA